MIKKNMGIMKEKNSMFRTLNTWNSKTFDEAVSQKKVKKEDTAAFEFAKKIIKRQKLGEKHMNGFASEGLKTTEKEQLGVCYVDFYNQMEDTGQYWDMVDLIIALTKFILDNSEKFEKKAKKNNITLETLGVMMCGRLLRALPSYIREEQLKNSLIKAFPKADFERDPLIDKFYHCDIKMTVDKKTYYIWSFLNSQRSISNFAKKFNGYRGNIPDGYHLLCPFNRQSKAVVYKGWCFYAPQNTDEVIAAMYQKQPEKYQEVVDNKTIYDQNFFDTPSVIFKAS